MVALSDLFGINSLSSINGSFCRFTQLWDRNRQYSFQGLLRDEQSSRETFIVTSMYMIAMMLDDYLDDTYEYV